MTFKKVGFLSAKLLIIFCIIFVIYFFWFTPIGYRISIPLHGFSKVSENIYIENGWNKDKEQLLAIVNEAKQRVNIFLVKLRVLLSLLSVIITKK